MDEEDDDDDAAADRRLVVNERQLQGTVGLEKIAAGSRFLRLSAGTMEPAGMEPRDDSNSGVRGRMTPRGFHHMVNRFWSIASGQFPSSFHNKALYRRCTYGRYAAAARIPGMGRGATTLPTGRRVVASRHVDRSIGLTVNTGSPTGPFVAAVMTP